MFNNSYLTDAIACYKKDFIQMQWPNEKYKWEAVKCFQDNWDVNAADFADMLTRSLAKTYNLLVSMNNFPAKMIESFAKAAPEEVRAMYLALFDETQDVISRILAFKDQAGILLEKYGNGAAQHYQYENAITTYLWLRYPEKYYIYKYSEVKNAAAELGCDLSFRKGHYGENLRNFYTFYNSLCEELKKEDELRRMLKSQLTETCYPDPELRTLTMDLGFYISRFYSQRNRAYADEWWPKAEDYDPGITVQEWKCLLADEEVFNESSLEIMKRMLDYGGKATCTQLSVKYGESPNFYNAGSSALAKRITEKTGCPVWQQDGSTKWWPTLYIGKKAGTDEEGVYIWKLREELEAALKETDLSQISLYVVSQEEDEPHYWWLNANPNIWSFSDLAVGEVQSYTLYNENGNKRRIFQNFLDAKAGNFIIGYESYPVKQVVAICKVTAEQDGEQIYFEKVEGLSAPIDYLTLKACPKLARMEYFVNQQGSLFKLTKGEFDFIMDMIRENNPSAFSGQRTEPYTKENFLEEVYMTEAKYNRLVSVLLRKKNIILQGAPGVGKTFAAKRLAYSIMGEKDESRVEFVQFHQNYSYEDFIMGYKPEGDSFALKYGIFYRFCQKAANNPDKDYFFIIDEINRGNMSKIFGELLMLIEKDYRGTKTALAYNGLSFSVPERVHIIGMMNTADRSLAMIDYALRRRFSFFEMEPGFESEGFVKYQNALNSELFDSLIGKITELNKEITADRSLGKGFCIGHSYFCGMKACTAEKLLEIVDFDVLPMLEEYWFDDLDKVQRWENILHGVFQ